METFAIVPYRDHGIRLAHPHSIEQLHRHSIKQPHHIATQIYCLYSTYRFKNYFNVMKFT